MWYFSLLNSITTQNMLRSLQIVEEHVPIACGGFLSGFSWTDEFVCIKLSFDATGTRTCKLETIAAPCYLPRLAPQKVVALSTFQFIVAKLPFKRQKRFLPHAADSRSGLEDDPT